MYRSCLAGLAGILCVLAFSSNGAVAQKSSAVEYRVLATSKTSTMEKELQTIGDQGYEALGWTVGQTLVGGKELVTITREQVK